jgi:hypothetical protein
MAPKASDGSALPDIVSKVGGEDVGKLLASVLK